MTQSNKFERIQSQKGLLSNSNQNYKSKSRYYVGLCRNNYGVITEKWLTEEQMQGNGLRYYLSKASMAGVGLFGVKKSVETYNKLQEWYVNQSPQTRRGFVKKLLGGMLIGAGLEACSKETFNEPIPETYEILGPSEVTMPRMGCQAEGIYSYKGNMVLDVPSWKLHTPSALQGSIRSTGVQELNCGFPIPGFLELNLFPDAYSTQKLASKTVKVNPPASTGKDYDLPLLLLVRENPMGPNNYNEGMYTYDPKTRLITKLFESNKLYGDCTAWSPDGKMIAFTYLPDGRDWRTDPHKIATYNLLTGKLKMISSNTERLAWKVTWSPKGDWIAYVDDSQSIGMLFGKLTVGVFDEIKISRPDGTEQFYLRGEGDENHIINNGPDFAALSLSWDPTGSHLIGVHKRKLVIFENVLSNNITRRTPVLSQNQLTNLYYNNSFNIIENISTAVPGANGVAWSPCGEYLAYTLQFGIDIAYNTIAISRVDGTGDIKIIDLRSGIYEIAWIEVLTSPTWSPDGNKIYYTGMDEEGFKYNLYEVDVTIENPVPVKIDLGLLNPRNVSLYG